MPNRAYAGRPVDMPATLMNRLQDMAAQSIDRHAGDDSQRLPSGVPAFGFAAADIADLAVVAITSTARDPHTASSYDADLSFTTPTWPASLGAIAIANQPMRSGIGGYAIIGGIAVASVNVASTGDRFATLDPSTPTQLKSSDTGELQLINPGSTGVRRCVVRFLGGPVLWRYKLNGAFSGGAASSKLMRLDGTQYAATITLNDPLDLMDDQVTDSQGFCHQVGNKFYAIAAPCES